MLKEHLNIECNLRVVQTSHVVRRGGGRQLRPGHQRDRLHADGPVRLSSPPGTARTARRTTRGWTNPAVPRPRQPDRARARRQQAQGHGPQGRGHPRERPAADPGGVRADLRRLVQQGARPEPVARTSASTTWSAGTTSGWLRASRGRHGSPDERSERRPAHAEVPRSGGRSSPWAPCSASRSSSSWSCAILPGDPLVAILGVEGHAQMTPADRARIMADLGLSDPLPVQYVPLARRHRRRPARQVVLPRRHRGRPDPPPRPDQRRDRAPVAASSRGWSASRSAS